VALGAKRQNHSGVEFILVQSSGYAFWGFYLQNKSWNLYLSTSSSMDITYISCVLKDGSHQNIIKIHQVSIEPIEIALGIYLNPHSTFKTSKQNQ
jgi:hypothetical protein